MNLIRILTLITVINSSAGMLSQLSIAEKRAVNKLRNLVSSKLTLEYMKSDGYLVKWLKAKHFNVDQAQKALEKTLEWRKETDADNLPYYDFSSLNKHYVFDFTTTKDINGKPVVLMPLGDWNVRKKVIEGRVITDLSRRMDYMEEKAAQLSFNLTGDTTSMIIADLAGTSLRQHACAGCIPFYLNWVMHHELHYPYNFYKVYCINTPAIFDPIVRLIRPLMTTSTKEALRIFGYDRNEWSKYVLETISPDQLPVRFGGTKKFKLLR